MAGFNFSPIAIQPQPQTSLGDMLNIAKGAQAYQQAQQLNPLQIEQAQKALQKQQMDIEQARMMNPIALKEAQARAESAVTGAQKAKQDFLVSGENYSRQMINSLPKIDEFTDEKSGEVNQRALTKSLEIIRKGTEAVGLPKHPSNLLGQLEEAIANKDYDAYEKLRSIAAKSSGTTSEQYAAKFPATQFLGTGGEFNPIAGGNPDITGVAPGTLRGKPLVATPSPLPYSQRMVDTNTKDISGNPIFNVMDDKGRVIGQTTVPASVPPNAMPGAKTGQTAEPTLPVTRVPFENEETVKTAKAIQQKAIEQRLTVPQSTYNYNQIIDLANKSITGVGAQTIAKLGGGYSAIPWTSDETSNLQQLGHYMALQTGNLAQQAGLGTDQGRSIAQEQIGTTNWTNDAIKSTARTNRALVTASDLYGLGMSNAIKKAGNNPLAGRDYMEKWASVAEIDALKYYDAIKNKDKVEIRKIIDKVGGPNSEGYADLIKKYNKIYSLVTGNQ